MRRRIPIELRTDRKMSDVQNDAPSASRPRRHVAILMGASKPRRRTRFAPHGCASALNGQLRSWEADSGPRETRESQAERPQRPQANAGKAESDPWTVPQQVRDRFVQDGHRFYFRDGSPAFRDHGRRLSTASENTELIASLIDIARWRGWQEITVEGTERFRKEAWHQARLLGLAVRGYKPTPSEHAAMIRELSHRERSLDPEDPAAGAATARAARVPEQGDPDPAEAATPQALK